MATQSRFVLMLALCTGLVAASTAKAAGCPEMAIAYNDLATAQYYVGQMSLGGSTDRYYDSVVQSYLSAALSEIRAGQYIRGCPSSITYVDTISSSSPCTNRGSALSLMQSGINRIDAANAGFFGGHGWNALEYSNIAYDYMAADINLFPQCR